MLYSFTMETESSGETITSLGNLHCFKKANSVNYFIFLHLSCAPVYLYFEIFKAASHISHWHTCLSHFRINLPKRRSRGAEDEESEGGVMKNSGSSEQLDADGDTASEVSSEVSFSYEFAQTEVMMKALGNNGNSWFST